MTLRDFSTADICRILRASKGVPLKAIICGPLKILFHAESPKEIQVELPKLAGQPIEPKEVTTGDVILDTELNEIIDEIAQENFMIQDPAAYEQQYLDERVYDRGDQGEPGGRGTEARRS